MMIEKWASTAGVIVCGIYTIYYGLRRFNSWWYEPVLNKGSAPLPPGDMGWPFLGNMLTFLTAFKSTNPEAFISSFVCRFNRVGLFKAFMFGKPTILATTPEACRLVLMDDAHFIPGWPKSTVDLIGSKSFVNISFEEHKRLRKLTAAPMTGTGALSKHLTWMEETVVFVLENCSKMDKVDFLTEIRKLTFNIIACIFLGNEPIEELGALEREYTCLNLVLGLWQSIFLGLHTIKPSRVKPDNGGVFLLKQARKRLVAILQSIIDKRRAGQEGKEVAILQSIIDKRRAGQEEKEDKNEDMLDELLKVRDQHDQIIEDEEIIDLLIMYLNAGHESSGHLTMWTIVFLLRYPEMYTKAKAEQENIISRRPEAQTHLIYSELREMEYLHKVINETLRLVNVSPMVFREALDNVALNGYTIPKAWKIQVWLRNVHLDPEVYPHPKKFDPERWDNFVPKPGMFIPFGAGSRLCPGIELVKMELCVIVHCMLLHYEVERLTPDCKVRYLPHPRPIDNYPVKIRKLKMSSA